jgi:ribonuclease R
VKKRIPKKSSTGGSRQGAGAQRPRAAQFGGRRQDKPRGSSGHGQVVEGVVSAHRSGFGFVRVEGMVDNIFLPPREMAQLMHGDRVRVLAEQGSDQRWSGRVEKLLERGVEAFLATVEIQGRNASVHSADRRLALYCQVPPEHLNGARHGDWVIARVLKYPGDGQIGTAKVDRRLDPERPVTLATEASIARFDLPEQFSAAAVRDAEAYGSAIDPAEAARRVDLRAVPLVTIDGEDAKDFDDAVYAEAVEGGFRLLVAIADVSHYVREGTALDDEARERGTSVYFPQRVVPMLPPALSDKLCSLQPQVDRLCLVADMQISKTGVLKGAHFYPAVMRSAARLTYNLAHAALFEGRPEARRKIGGVLDRILPLVDVYRALHGARAKRGALDFDAPEAKFQISETEQIHGIALYARNDAHRLIEECMVLANVAAARELEDNHIPTLYRVHAQPDTRKLDNLVKTLRALGVGVELPEQITTRDLQKIAPRIKDPAARPFIEQLVVRSMMQALYAPINIGHFGLALKQYAHFTSPIRRYPDLVVHRTIKSRLTRDDASGRSYSPDEALLLGEQLSSLEKRADEADRYVDNFLKCVYLRDRIGQTFEGLITAVVDFGCFVQILEAAVDGLLHLDNLRDDEYVKDDDGQAWIGVRSKRRLRLGTHVRVIVTSVNPVEGLIDIDLAIEPPIRP